RRLSASLRSAGCYSPLDPLWRLLPRGCLLALELLLLGRAEQRQRGGLASGDDLGDLVEVARPHLTLVAGRGVALGLQGELTVLDGEVGTHVVGGVAPGQLEHRHVEGVEARERGEVEQVAPGAQPRFNTCGG